MACTKHHRLIKFPINAEVKEALGPCHQPCPLQIFDPNEAKAQHFFFKSKAKISMDSMKLILALLVNDGWHSLEKS